MSTYLLRPKTLPEIPEFSSPARVLEELGEIRRADPRDTQIREWLDDFYRGKQRPDMVPRGDDGLITGIHIAELTSEEVAQVRQDLPDNVLIEGSREIKIIRPKRAPIEAKEAIAQEDLWHLRAIGLEDARNNGFQGTGAGVTVAILDTGVDTRHPELEKGVRGAFNFDILNRAGVPAALSVDRDGHGTLVAGLLCGRQIGVAPGVELFSGAMLPTGSGDISAYIVALEWLGQVALENKIRVVNISAGELGFFPDAFPSVKALLGLGILPVFATGNDGAQTISPGNFQEPLSVGASNESNQIPDFSGGEEFANPPYVVPDLVAPGVNVFSCTLDGQDALYEPFNGTSLSAPIVSGIAALVIERHPAITVTDLIGELLEHCIPLGNFPLVRQGRGLIQVTPAL